MNEAGGANFSADFEKLALPHQLLPSMNGKQERRPLPHPAASEETVWVRHPIGQPGQFAGRMSSKSGN
jgi:hypothetical protein